MKPSTKRIILRIVHLVAIIPALRYVYQPVAEATVVRVVDLAEDKALFPKETDI